MSQKYGRIAELESLILRYSDAYYNDEAEVPDSVFDKLSDELRKLAPNAEVLAQVGAKPKSTVWPEIKHTRHMGSQLKVNSAQEAVEWAQNCGVDEVCWSEKLDGSSLGLEYRSAELRSGWSRGDGIIGSDITSNVLKMKATPRIKSFPHAFGTRGEVIMKKATFDAKYKGKRDLESGRVFKNPRNAAAGIARRLSGIGCDDLGVICYGVEDVLFATEAEKFQWLEDQGFYTPAWGVIKVSEIAALYQRYIDSDRDGCPFEIDGIILAVNDLKLQKSLGMTDNRPKGQRALKFPAPEVETTINSVTWQTGRTGRITPVAEIEPTDIGGVTISRVMLNNLGLIKERGYGVGSRALLRRANDVIPELMAALTPGKPIAPPKECPSCSGPTSVDGANLVCTNKACSAQVLAHLLNFLRVLGVKGFGLSTIETLVEREVLKSIADFYRLTPNDFESLKTGTKLVAEFQAKAKEMTLPTFVDSLGIPGVGQHLTELAMQQFGTIGELRNASVYFLTQIQGIGEELAGALVEGLSDRADLIDELLKLTTITEPKKVVASGTKCEGFVVIFTGFRDELLEEFVVTEGGRVASSMSKAVTHVVAKDTTGSSSKLVKARAAGLTVWSRAELQALAQ